MGKTRSDRLQGGLGAALLLAVWLWVLDDGIPIPDMCNICQNIGCWYCYLWWCGC